MEAVNGSLKLTAIEWGRPDVWLRSVRVAVVGGQVPRSLDGEIVRIDEGAYAVFKCDSHNGALGDSFRLLVEPRPLSWVSV